MGIVDLYRYLRGYIKFSAIGGFTERFINLCATRRVPLFNSVYTDGGVSAETDIKNFFKLREIARKTGVRISVITKKGLLFYIKEKRYRCGMIVGSVMYCIFLVIMNLFVWNIEAGGSEKYSPEQLIEAAERVGVKCGICRFVFDERKAAREIYKAFNDDLSWVAVNIIGSKCYINVRDSDNKAEKKEFKEPANLIADFDGVILSDETYSGIKIISKGNAVKEGDLLISGVMDNENGTAVYYSANGNFTARHNRYFKCETGNESYLRPSLPTEATTTVFFGVPINGKSGSEKINKYKRSEVFTFDKHPLPFGYIKTVLTDEADVSLSEKEKLLLTADLYTVTSYNSLGNTKILAYEMKISYNNKNCYMRGKYDCIDFIGISKPILVENIESK